MAESTPTILPLFPLELVVFPGQTVKLHIFEPRYKELIGECEERAIPFGIPAFHEKRLVPYGTEMRLVEIRKRYPDGELDIRVEGQRGFRLLRYLPDIPGHQYSAGEVEFLSDQEDALESAELTQLCNRLHGLLATGFSCDTTDGPGLAFRLADHVGLDLPQKVRLLSLERESERRAFLVAHLNRMIPMVERAEELKRRIGGNGHFTAMPKFHI